MYWTHQQEYRAARVSFENWQLLVVHDGETDPALVLLSDKASVHLSG
jgi:hypothetical protein